MAATKQTSSRSKSPKKVKMGSPMKKKSSKALDSPKKSHKQMPNRRIGIASRSKYQQMVTEALKTLDSRKGSTRSKIMNHIKLVYGIEGGKSANNHLRTALEALAEESIVSLAKGTGYNDGYYRITPKGRKQDNNNKPSSPKKAHQISSSKSQNEGQSKKAASKPRSQSKSTKQNQPDGRSRSRPRSKSRSKSSNTMKSPTRKSIQSSPSRSRSPSKAKSGSQRKSNTSSSSKSRRSMSRSLTKSQTNIKSQSPVKQQGRVKAGQKRQALKEVHDNQKSTNEGKQKRSRSSKEKSSGKNDDSNTSPTKKSRNSAGGSKKKGSK